MVTGAVAPHSAFGVRVRERSALRGALLDRDRPQKSLGACPVEWLAR